MSDLKPAAWQFYQDGKWHTGMEHNNHKQNTIDGGYPVRDLYPVEDLNKIKVDAVREARQDIVDNVITPKAAQIRQEYYKAAIRHAIQNLEAYANKLERGE